MNNLKLYLAYLLLVSLFFVSCNIEPYEGEIIEEDTENVVDIDTPIGIDSAGLGAFQIDFDGDTYEAENVVGTFAGGIMNISAFKGNNQELFTITLFASETGTYQVGVTENGIEVASVAYNESVDGDVWIGVTDFISSQGEITITEIDEENKTISGVFFFTGHSVDEEAKEFTNGAFTNVSYGTDLVPSNSANSFFAKVDGAEFLEDGVLAVAINSNGFNNIGISATKNSVEIISLNFDGDVKPGEYELTTFSLPNGIYSKSFSESYSSETGKVIITTHDVANKRIVGTFEFTATSFLIPDEAHEVTEGRFDVTYL